VNKCYERLLTEGKIKVFQNYLWNMDKSGVSSGRRGVLRGKHDSKNRYSSVRNENMILFFPRSVVI
jgi:hypothetical protein